MYFVGMLPYGTYYLHETTIPSGHQEVTEGNDGNWFTLTVNEDGVTGTDTEIKNILYPEETKPN